LLPRIVLSDFNGETPNVCRVFDLIEADSRKLVSMEYVDGTTLVKVLRVNPPLHTLPHDELLAKLKSLTNLRAVRDPASDTGWKVQVGPFPGCGDVPEWNP
jgi:hypothetical protein